MTDYVWFITATSSGFGEAIAFDALRRGHKVIATARDSSKLDKLRAAGAAVMDLDVTCDEETLAAKLAEANAIYGKITHVASCAGYILEGTVEEASAKEVYNEFNTNVFGVCNIARAVTPYLREAAKSGQQTALANFGSLGSWLSSAAVAHYCSTKFAVTGLTEGLADELKPFGIDVCDIEPGYTRTGFLASGEAGGRDGRVKTARKLPVYGGTHPAAAVRDNMNAYNGKQPNDVTKSARLIVDVLTRTGVAEGKGVPIRLVLGQDCLDVARKKCADTLRLKRAALIPSSMIIYRVSGGQWVLRRIGCKEILRPNMPVPRRPGRAAGKPGPGALKHRGSVRIGCFQSFGIRSPGLPIQAQTSWNSQRSLLARCVVS